MTQPASTLPTRHAPSRAPARLAGGPGGHPSGLPARGGPNHVLRAKVVVAGGFGVGKTTFVSAVSEIPPVTTDAMLTEHSREVDDVSLLPGKQATTVGMDFGRTTIDGGLVVYLFGTPGQARFWFMWDDIVRGAVGAVVLTDTRRLAESFGAVDFFEERSLPYVVAVNAFHGRLHHRPADIRSALSLSAAVPLVPCDARSRRSAASVVARLTEHAKGAGAARRSP